MARSNTSGKKDIDAGSAPFAIGTLGFSPTAGRCLVIYGGIILTSGTLTVLSVAANVGSTWTLKQRAGVGGHHFAFIAWLENIPGGITTVNITCGAGASGYVACAVDEFDDITTSTAFDQTNGGGTDMSGAAVSSGNITTTQATELLLTAAVSDDNGTTAWASIGGSGTWTQSFQEADTTAHAAAQAGYQYVASTGTYNSTQRYSITTNGPDDSVLIASLKMAAASGSAVILARGDVLSGGMSNMSGGING